MENELCDKLRKEIFAEKCEPTQRLREFQRWKGLLSVDNIKADLKNERASLLTELISYINKVGSDFESKANQKSVSKPPLVNNMSRIINDIVWARQMMSSKVLSTQKVAESLFSDLDGMDEFKASCADISRDIKDYENKQFKRWLADVENLVKTKKDTLLLSGRPLEIDASSGLLKVRYNEKKLATLLKDTRQLTELGFKIPKQLVDIIESSRKFYKEGIALRQVVNFFNSMSSQIMDCHSAMLLRKTVAFEKLVKGTSNDKNDAFGKSAAPTWSNPVELEEYINEVQSACNDLSKENRKLRKMHTEVVDYIQAMMNIDLLKNKDLWKEKLDVIKRIMDSTNYSAKETKAWRTHLDYQLYKALEYQYQMGLESLNENFNIIEADLVYADKSVSFRPPIEALKAKYYKEISNFITFPMNFTGLGGKPSIFKVIPSKNAESLMAVYSKAEELFARLEKMINTFVPWTALGHFDLETYIEENFKDVKDWENNYKMLRTKRKQLDKLNEYYKIDNFFNIRTEPFKKGIEDLFQKMTDVLKFSLRSSIKVDMESIDVFIEEGMKKLNARPQSVEEIGLAKSNAVEISGKKSSFVALYNQCEQRNLILKQISGEGAQIGDMQNRWENFDVALSAFSSMIDEQKNVLKQETDKRISALNSELEKTFNRWEALKPKERGDMDRETAMETSEKMKEWREKWDELEKKIKNITEDCHHFGIDMPKFGYYEELKGDLAKQEESWRFYDEFYKELAELGKEDWLSFSRGKGIYQFQDFMDKWAEKIKTREPDQVKRLLLKAIDHFKEAWPLFKI